MPFSYPNLPSGEQARAVRQYYDTNIAAFEARGEGADNGAIHRAIWGPGVISRSDAFHYVDRQIETHLPAVPADSREPLRVLDLSCGVGATLCWLAARQPIEGVGLTLSGVQARRANQRFAGLGLTARLCCLETSYLDFPAAFEPADVAFSIESFVHAPSPAAFFQAATRHIRPGGKLIVCDDFLTPRTQSPLSRQQSRCLRDFSDGWIAPSIVTVEEAQRAATEAGFQPISSTDLTPHLELRRPREQFLSLLVAVGRRLPIPGDRWRNLLGGDALQSALRNGLIEYRFLVWRR